MNTVPIRTESARTDHQVLVSIAFQLEELLAEARRTNARLAMADATHAASEPKEQRSSVEIKTSARGVDISVKCYSGSDILEPESAAIESYGRLRAEAEQRFMNGEKLK